jgi:hypothetical protein
VIIRADGLSWRVINELPVVPRSGFAIPHGAGNGSYAPESDFVMKRGEKPY